MNINLPAGAMSTSTSVPVVSASGAFAALIVAVANAHGIPMDIPTATLAVSGITGLLAYLLPHKGAA